MKKNVVRALALVLVALMCLSLIPLAAHADEGHVHYFEPITVPPTCQYNGYVQMICEACGAGGEIQNFIPPTGKHDFIPVEDEQYVIEEGDCEHATLYWKSCSVCEISAEEEYGEQIRKMQEELVGRMAAGEIDLNTAQSIAEERVHTFDEHYKFSAGGTGHHYVQVERQEATCTSDGWNDHSYCDVCGEYFGYEAIPAKGHRWSEYTVTAAPTCTQDGSRERVCDVCGEKDVEVLPALGHKWGEFTVTKAATCTQDGSMERTCTVCGEKEVVVIPAAHKWGEFTVTVEPGCNSTGTKVHTCTVCGVTETESIPAAHKFGEFTVTQEPGCYASGQREAVCAVCGEVAIEYIPAAHKYENGVCTVCGEPAPEGYVAAEAAVFQGEEEKTEGETLNGEENATFEAAGVTIKFDGNGATSGTMADLAVPSSDEGGVNLTANVFERTEYAFTGWNTQSDGSGKSFEDKQYVSANDFTSYDTDVKLYAQWVEIKVMFNSNGGSGSMTDQKITEAKAPLKANTFSRNGYTFAGWDTDNSGHGQHFKDGEEVSTAEISAPTTLYAQWKRDVHVTYQSNVDDGSGKTSYSEPTKYPGDTLTIKTLDETGIPTKANRIFVEWNTARDGSGDSYVPGDKMDITDATPATVMLYAQWGFAVEFNANEGDGYIEPKDAIENKELELPENNDQITREGYYFDGWNTLKDGSGTAYADGATIPATAMTGPITLYAQWKSSDIKVSFDPNGGSGSMDAQPGTIGEDLTLKANEFTRDKYGFTGWNTQKDGSGTGYDDKATVRGEDVTGDFTLYAQWQKKITVSFKPNGGSGNMEDQLGGFSTALKLRTNTFTREGYSFTGWNTEANGKGTAYGDKGTVPASVMTGDITLYAQWEKDKLAVSFNANGGTGTMTEQEFTLTDPPETILLKANTFTYTNYTFDKWTEKADGSGKSWPDQGDYVADAGRTLYAQWVKTAFSVNYDKNGGGGAAMSPTNVDKGNSGTVKANSYNAPDSGKVFGEWNTKADGSGISYQPGESIKSDDVPSDITLYAIWRDKLAIWFYPGEGSGTAQSLEEPQDSQVKLPTPASLGFEPLSGMAFAGWEIEGEPGLYKSGAVYTFKEAKTVTAKWAREITITYDPNGAVVSSRKLQRAAKDTDTKLATIDQIGYARTGYAFTGWGRLSGTDPEKPDFTDNQLVVGGFPNDTTLYALWLKHAFTGKVNVTGSLSFGSETAYVDELLYANVTGEDYFNKFTYQWYRDGYGDSYMIVGETKETYTPTAEDFGHVIFCVVTAEEADEGENTAISNLKIVGIDESDKRIVNLGQTESDFIYGLLPDMMYSINNGPKDLVELDEFGLFEVKQQGLYRFYTLDGTQVGAVNVVNWWTIGYNVSTGTGDNAGSGTVTMRRGSTTLNGSTTITSDGVVILQPYSGVEGYNNVWIVRQDAAISDISLNIRPASSSYGHVSRNGGAYTSSSAERTLYPGTIAGPEMYNVVFNKSSSSPKTADMSNLGLWSALCFVSFVGAVSILGSARKRKKEDR